MADVTPSRTNAARAPAVVIGLDSITGLQTSRILADRGVPVVGVVADRRHWGARTRACREVLESPLRGDELVFSLMQLGRRLETRGVLFPCTDPSVEAVSRHRACLAEHFELPLASHQTVELLMDKVRFARHASAVGLPAPRTEILRSLEDTLAVADALRYPCVLKPAGKSATWLAQTSAKGFAVHDRDELLAIYNRVRAWAPELVLQEWVAGPETSLFSCNGYFGDEGDPLVTFVARKTRQWPPKIGTSASGQECREDEVLRHAVRLFRDLRFKGLAYLEMKRDVRTGDLMVIEANVGRPTGRSAIAEAGGVELVHTAYCDATGLPLPEDREQMYVGAKWLDLRRDLQAAVVAHRRGTLSVREWLRSVRGPKAHAIWSAKDPAPFFIDLLQASATGTRMLLTSRTSLRGRPGSAAQASHRSGDAERDPNLVLTGESRKVQVNEQ